MTAQILAFPDLLPPPPPLDLAACALFLDLDGVLAPIVARPTDVGPDPRRNFILRLLSGRLDQRLAIVSGRTLAEVSTITENAVRAVAGVHGLERRTVLGHEVIATADPDLHEAVAVFRALARAQPELLVEEKGLSVALHYRACPSACEAVREIARRLEAATGLVLQEGDMVAELRTAGADKGQAVGAFMAEWPFQGSRPIFVGDDLTDEDGFAAAAGAGGYGILVGSGRQTMARYRLADVPAVLDWLEAAITEPVS
ncbi:MAG TPA: trehalose-phosphatase [Caulobacter sp.]|nr:trehalose-phosphatase [Caulobacter sp.]